MNSPLIVTVASRVTVIKRVTAAKKVTCIEPGVHVRPSPSRPSLRMPSHSLACSPQIIPVYHSRELVGTGRRSSWDFTTLHRAR